MSEENRLSIYARSLVVAAEKDAKAFRAIGEFIYSFSQLEFTIRYLLGEMLRA
jgi:hypothetical protein